MEILITVIILAGFVYLIIRKNVGNPVNKTDSMLMREYGLHQRRVDAYGQVSTEKLRNALTEMSLLTDEMRERGLLSDTALNAPWIADKVLEGKDISHGLQTADADAQFMQGRLFAATNDIRQAIKWFRRSADQGHSGAMYMLGFAYIEGKIEGDIAQCYKWLKLSAIRGHPQAAKALETVIQQTTSEQRAEGERLAAAFQSEQY